MKHVVTFLIAVILFTACTKTDINKVTRDNKEKVSIETGVWGTVSFKEGNCMPGIGNISCRHYPVSRTVRIYNHTTVAQATPAESILNGFYSQFSTNLVKEVQADNDGFFEATLPPGEYTLVVMENNKLYANLISGNGTLAAINPITITTGLVNKDVLIDYKAAY